MTETNEQFAERMRLKRGEPPSRRRDDLTVLAEALRDMGYVDDEERVEEERGIEKAADASLSQIATTYGMARMPGETDEDLRERVVRLLALGEPKS